MKLEGTRFVMSPNGSALGLPAGEYWAVPDSELRWAQEQLESLREMTIDRDEHLAKTIEQRDRLAALSRIIRRALACGQLEKLEDARRYLDDAEQGAPKRPEGG